MNNDITYAVYFLSLNGGWKLHHEFQSREHALASAVTVSQFASATVNETVRKGGKIVSEKCIAERRRAA